MIGGSSFLKHCKCDKTRNNSPGRILSHDSWARVTCANQSAKGISLWLSSQGTGSVGATVINGWLWGPKITLRNYLLQQKIASASNTYPWAGSMSHKGSVTIVGGAPHPSQCDGISAAEPSDLGWVVSNWVSRKSFFSLFI